MKTNRIQIIPVLLSFFTMLILCSGFPGKEKKGPSDESLIISGCDNSNSNNNPDFVNHYKKIENYIPDDNTPIKHIRIALNVFTGPGTLQNTSETVDALNQMIEWLNSFYTNVDSATYPIAGVASPTDTKIRFDLDGRIFFYEGTKLYENTSMNSLEKYITGVDSSRLDNLNIYLTNGGTASPYSIPPFPSFVLKDGSGQIAPSLSGSQGVYISTARIGYANSQTLAHEIGHCLDLFHTYNPSCCHETCDASDPEYLMIYSAPILRPIAGKEEVSPAK